MTTTEGIPVETPTDTNGLVVSVRNLSKVYSSGDRTVRALDNVSAEIPSGSVTGILGPNGAGKTTLIKSIIGLVRPTSGTIHVNGYDPHEDSKAVHRSVAAVFEGARNTYWRLSVLENMRFFSAVSGNDPSQQRDYFDLLLERFDFTHKCDTPVRELSRGQKQKASILCALAREPQIMFLDEPTLGLDVQSSIDLRAELDMMVDVLGNTIAITSHDMDVIQDICDNVLILIDGKVVVSDTLAELLNRFGVQSYYVTVAESLSESEKNRLKDSVDARKFHDRRSSTRFQFQTDSGSFYEAIAELETQDLSIKKIESVEPNLEEVFVDITEQRPGDEPSIGGNL